ncbi:alpha-D-ribose 1-methylphosphonate 5-phosphate C-P-lyase PhnJ (plasmid) [Microvirga sp. VF16]|nr:alpha-D-ribose 1-methylphosphonate 5-phosphate C-P-lyase PhnJ [Microvirga sp. VF16]QRM33377.1 alpha-D-ribose 1-methylphosphonate 5-phosphate C-P-lyase PhnJ [Microvirga sp. VF16]
MGSGREEPSQYSSGYLNETTKRTLRRAILKAVCIPGFQIPIAGYEMPLPPGWGTGGMQVTAALIGRDDVLKVIDQGADDSINATSIRKFFERVTDIRTTVRTADATMIQSRHRIPEGQLTENQIVVLQVPVSEPLRYLEPSDAVTRRQHASQDYGMLYVRLYEDRIRVGDAKSGTNHPVRVNDRYFVAPSPIPISDNPRLDGSPALVLFGAGRNRRIYAIPPYTKVESLSFDDQPFSIKRPMGTCMLCGAHDTYLDIVAGDDGERSYTCSDTSYCAERREKSEGHRT